MTDKDSILKNNIRTMSWVHDHVEDAEFVEIGKWFLSVREIETGLMTLILTKGGFKRQHRSVIVKSEDYKVHAISWALPLVDFHEGNDE